MLKRYLSSSLLTALLLCLMASGLMATKAAAQETRPAGLYIRARVGANSFAGDRDFNPDNEFGDFFGTGDEEGDGLNVGASADIDGDEDVSQLSFPSLGFDVGYNRRFGIINGGLALTYIGGRYTSLLNANFSDEQIPTENDTPVRVVDSESSRWRHTVGLVGRIGFAGGATVQPYAQIGGHWTFGNVFAEGVESNTVGSGGPMAGLGVDFALTPRIGLFLEGTAIGTFPDLNMDLHPGLEEDQNGFDLFGFYGGGLRVSLASPITPVEIVSLDCPAELESGASGTFTATINEGEATTPISSRWEFGDGTTETGLVATKTYNSPGSYDVTFTTSNEGAEVSESCTVEVVEPPVPASVASINANPNPSEPGESVSFTSNVRGDRPVECEWDFGDGESSTNCNPTHTYQEAGSYDVSFTASNEFGEDTASLTQVVEVALPAICTQVTDFNPAFFERNSSTLTAEARDALRENLEILSQCPNLCVDVEGFASRSERSPEELSQARADAVATYYEDNGVGTGRIDAQGMGARGQTTKKGGDTQFRRADSIPESCGPQGSNTDDDPAVGSDPNFDQEDMDTGNGDDDDDDDDDDDTGM